jgi:hypothetical protein
MIFLNCCKLRTKVICAVSTQTDWYNLTAADTAMICRQDEGSFVFRDQFDEFVDLGGAVIDMG